jgi:hypothetical protein
MKHKVQATFTQDEYEHLLALKSYFGFKSLSETVSFAVQKEIESHQGNAIYNFYLGRVRGQEMRWNSFMYLPKKEPELNEGETIVKSEGIGFTEGFGTEECKKIKKFFKEEYNMRLD